MIRVALTLLLLATTLTGKLTASETSVSGRLYANWVYDMTDGADGMNNFGLGRAYVTVKSRLSEQTSLRITSDLREATIEDEGKGSTRYYVIIKYGYIDWTPAFGKRTLTLRLGLQPTPYIDSQNKLWGRRYLAKTVGDEHKFLTSADLGVSVRFALGKRGGGGSLTLALFDGTAYSNLTEQNKHKDFNLCAQLTPFENSEYLKKSTLVAQFYRGTRNIYFDPTMDAGGYWNDLYSVGAFLAYRELVHFGADLNWHSEGQGGGNKGIKETGTSFHVTFFLGELAYDAKLLRTLNLFGRHDCFDPNTDVGANAEQLWIVGLECNPTKGFKGAVSLRRTSYNDDRQTEEQLQFNTLFKF